MAPREARSHVDPEALRCVTGGVVGGLAGAAAMMLLERVHGAHAVAGAHAFLGLMLYLFFALNWGLFFAVFVYGFSKPATLAVAPLFGLIVWLTMFYAVLPLLGIARQGPPVPPDLAACDHILFGFAVALGFLPFQSRTPVDPREILGRP